MFNQILDWIGQESAPMYRVITTLGGLGSFLSLLLAFYLEWDNIKARLSGRIPQAKQQVSTPTSNSPRPGIAGLIGDLLFDLAKSGLVIFTAIAICAEYLLIVFYYEPGLPIDLLMVVILALGSVLGVFLRAWPWGFIVLFDILSQIGFVAILVTTIAGWDVSQVGDLLSILPSDSIPGW